MITVKQLRNYLADLPDDIPIVLQKDDEGNGYRYMNGIDFETGDEANYFNEEGECVRASDFDEYLNKSDYPILVAVAY
jgi:hypothetical protein